MARYVYEPLVSRSLQEASRELRNGFREAHGYTNPAYHPQINRLYPGMHAHVERYYSRFDLVNLKQVDILYVLLLGQLGWNVLGAVDAAQGGPKFFDPRALARHLFDQKLRKGFKDLRILASHSATPYYPGGPTFAYQLKQEMVALGYDQITVTGYLGAFTDYGYKKRLISILSDFSETDFRLEESARGHKGVTLADGSSSRASHMKVKY